MNLERILEVAKEVLLEGGYNVEGQELSISESYTFQKEELDFIKDDSIPDDAEFTTQLGGFMNGDEEMTFTVITDYDNEKFLYLHIMKDDPDEIPVIDISKYNE